ncbi:homocitrate synthase [Dactylonectria estremocensis]|uniref:Homocitrate synthase n=1 Tax=Dactylonectria estremocensis TaxID=1079267 RepID=A0A9P9EUN5_9HYPO|nr:homocitrate synthase [Dactylonectria estremocensis]
MSTKNAITHHTSHTMENGAASGTGGGGTNGESQTAHGNAFANGNGSDLGTVLETPLTTSAVARLPNNENTFGGSEKSPAASEYDQPSSSSDSDDDGLTTIASSVSFSPTFSNFAIIDSTLREGEQFATAHFSTEQKIQIAKALDDIGVEYIEVTSPAASEQSFQDCKAICALGLKAKICCHIRCHMDDARLAVETGVDGINVCIGTSSQLMKHSHGKTMDQIFGMAKEVIEYVKSQNIEIRFSGEDSFRSDFNDIVKLYSYVDQLGVQRVGIADTVGGATSREVFDKVSTLRRTLGCDIETHFHNDTGCAISNALTALEAGATHIDTTVLGIGERNGITTLGGLITSLLRMEPKSVLGKYKIEKLREIDSLVAEIVGINIPFNSLTVSPKEISFWAQN